MYSISDWCYTAILQPSSPSTSYPPIHILKNPLYVFSKIPLSTIHGKLPPYIILKKIPYMYFPKPPYCIFHIVRKCPEMLWNNASDGKSSRISTGNALRCTGTVYWLKMPWNVGQMHARTHSDHFPPLTMMLIFHQPHIVPCLPKNYQSNIVDILDLTISTNYYH